MLQKNNRGPSAWGRRSGPEGGARPGLPTQHNTAVALQVYRPSLNRWATVAKLVPIGGELVLAIPYRNRQHLEGRISLPLAVLRYAQEHGARAIIVRFDAERQAFRLPLAEAFRLGRPGTLDGQGELWLRLADFEEAAWPDWPWASAEVRLGRGLNGWPRQLALLEGVDA